MATRVDELIDLCRKWDPPSPSEFLLMLEQAGIDRSASEACSAYSEWIEGEVPPFANEVEFRENLAKAIENHGHSVYFHEGDYERKFSVKGSKNGFVDLYVASSPDWAYRDIIPAFAIETKIAKGLGWLRDCIDQIYGYEVDEQAQYIIDGRPADPPALFLVATDHSVWTGYFYRWNLPQIKPQDRPPGWQMLTEIYDRILWSKGVALLRGDRFQTNKFGPPKVYSIRDRVAAEIM